MRNIHKMIFFLFQYKIELLQKGYVKKELLETNWEKELKNFEEKKGL